MQNSASELTSEPSKIRWYAIHVRSNFERRATTELSGKGLETYLPAYEEVHQWKDRKKKVTIPLFPGYVFVRFPDLPTRRLTVLQAAGVVRILGSGESIESVPEEQIDSIQRLIRSAVRCTGHPFLREGVRVRVARGALRGLEGILTQVKNQTRLVVSVPLLGQSIAAEVSIRDVEILQQSSCAN